MYGDAWTILTDGGLNLKDCYICEITMSECTFYHHAKLYPRQECQNLIQFRKYSKQSCNLLCHKQNCLQIMLQIKHIVAEMCLLWP
jgi:hypothetical protein